MTQDKTIRVSGNGIEFGTVLFFIFLVLKLTDKIDWSWWWVTSPLWIPFAAMFIFLALFAFIAFVALILNNK